MELEEGCVLIDHGFLCPTSAGTDQGGKYLTEVLSA